MKAYSDKFVKEGWTFDDVLLGKQLLPDYPLRTEPDHRFVSASAG